jgi:hypothetical protein
VPHTPSPPNLCAFLQYPNILCVLAPDAPALLFLWRFYCLNSGLFSVVSKPDNSSFSRRDVPNA